MSNNNDSEISEKQLDDRISCQTTILNWTTQVIKVDGEEITVTYPDESKPLSDSN